MSRDVQRDSSPNSAPDALPFRPPIDFLCFDTEHLEQEGRDQRRRDTLRRRQVEHLWIVKIDQRILDYHASIGGHNLEILRRLAGFLAVSTFAGHGDQHERVFETGAEYKDSFGPALLLRTGATTGRDPKARGANRAVSGGNVARRRFTRLGRGE